VGGATFLARLQHMPALKTEGLWTTSEAGLRSEVTGSVKRLEESNFDFSVRGDGVWV
jgi:hypothetical protein